MRIALFGLALLVSCGGLDSTTYVTPEIEATMRVINKAGNTATVEVILLAPSTGVTPKYIKLGEGDALTVSYDGNTETLDQVSQGAIQYGLDIEVGGGTEFTLTFERQANDTAAGNVIFLPAPFEFGGVSGTVNAEDGLQVDWTGGEGGYTLSADGDCIQHFETSVNGEDGEIVVPFESFVPMDVENPVGCSLALRMMSERDGSVDELWREGSSATGRTWREATSNYAP